MSRPPSRKKSVLPGDKNTRRPKTSKRPASLAEDILFGQHAVTTLLEEGPSMTAELLVEQHQQDRHRSLIERARFLKIPIRYDALSQYLGGQNAQGIGARLLPYRYSALEDLVEGVCLGPQKILLLLDCIQDPHNLGAILRTAAFFGVSGVVIPKDRSATITPTVIRISSGGAFRVGVAQVTNMARTIRGLKDQGIVVAGAAAHDGMPLTSLNTPGPMALVLGAEGPGLRRLVAESCDFLVSIPSIGAFESLNVSVAAGILMYGMSLGRAAP